MYWQYWRHRISGDVYAVQLEDEKTGPRACIRHVRQVRGPLDLSEVTITNQSTGRFVGGVVDPRWVMDRSAEFTVYQLGA